MDPAASSGLAFPSVPAPATGPDSSLSSTAAVPSTSDCIGLAARHSSNYIVASTAAAGTSFAAIIAAWASSSRAATTIGTA